MCMFAIVANLTLAFLTVGSFTDILSQNEGSILAALIAAVASIANTLILTRVRSTQRTVGIQVAQIKRYSEAIAEDDENRASQITMLRELSRDRERQIAKLSIVADRLSGHVDHLESREHRTREDGSRDK